MTLDQTLLRVIKRSRHRPSVGDIFVMQLRGGDFLSGRVILAEPPRAKAPGPATYLIYVYRNRKRDALIDWDRLGPEQLLLPPVWINRLPWTKGYFVTVANTPIREADLLGEHCFLDHLTGRYVDETGTSRASRVEPCGSWALSSYKSLDLRIGDALGMARPPGLEHVAT